MRPYVLSQEAADELREIARYTVDRWGVDQCNQYLEALEQKATALARGEQPYRPMDDVLSGLRVAKSGKHYIFCVIRPNEPALILAVLHENMDMLTRIKGRLPT